jgi:hypothetical protein
LAAPSAESASWTPEELQARVDAVQSQLEQELAAQEARDASLENPYSVETGGAGNSVRQPVQLARRRFVCRTSTNLQTGGLLLTSVRPELVEWPRR